MLWDSGSVNKEIACEFIIQRYISILCMHTQLLAIIIIIIKA